MTNRKLQIETVIQSMMSLRRKLFTDNHNFGCGLEITPSQWAVVQIIKQEGVIGVSEIADKLGVSTSAATQLIDNLVNSDFLVRESDPADRRATKIKFSDKMKERVGKMRDLGLEKTKIFFEVLNDDELALFAKLIKKIADNILKTKED